MQDEYLFPIRQTRRDFLGAACAAAAAVALPALGRGAEDKKAAVTFGSGKASYTLDEDWGALPPPMKYGFGCAVVVDSKDRVFVTSRSNNPCVAIFDKDGKLLETWSKEIGDKIGYTTDQIAATAHGLYWSNEPDGEFLYWTENVAKDKTGRIGARVYKTDMQGKVLYTVGNVNSESATSQKFNFVNPTDVAVAANGDIYVVDGYGSQLLHRFDKNFKLIKTVGGPGKEHGKFNTCHGVWVNTLKKEPELYIADRANNRIEVLSLEMDYKRTVPGVKMPCCFYQHKGQLFVPELGARVTILDDQDKVVAQMGDGSGVKPTDIRNHPDKFATPHALTVASNGDWYLVEWLDWGRPRKFKHTPQA